MYIQYVYIPPSNIIWILCQQVVYIYTEISVRNNHIYLCVYIYRTHIYFLYIHIYDDIYLVHIYLLYIHINMYAYIYLIHINWLYMYNDIYRIHIYLLYIHMYADIYHINFRSLALMVLVWRCLEDYERKDHRLNLSINQLITRLFVEQPRLHRVC